uniref:Ig-like domain-containing protein n=1 Tax=Sander lucioperca TaxID=283035 RepID=A0A8D0A5R3_SANLU
KDCCIFICNCLLSASSCSDTKTVTAKPGEDVLLHCQDPRDADIRLIVWSRTDLESDKYVFFHRENRLNEKYQLPSYRGRVNLSDPEMKDGDVSVVLKNVSVNNTGTYQCQVGISGGEEPKLYSTIQLNVEGEFVEMNLRIIILLMKKLTHSRTHASTSWTKEL